MGMVGLGELGVVHDSIPHGCTICPYPGPIFPV